MTRSQKLRKFLIKTRQSLYITTNLFFQNSMPTIASACAFGMLFSVLPVVFLIITVLIRVLHTEHSFVMQFYQYISMLVTQEQFEQLVQTILSVEKVGSFEIISIIAIFWLARRFFLSVMRGFHIINHIDSGRKGITSTMGGFFGETIAVIGVAIIISAVFAARSLLKVDVFADFLPFLDGTLYPLLVSLAPPVMLYIIIFLTYRFAPGTKPKLGLCARAALYTSAIYKLMQLVFKLFLNTSRYNMIYGVLSNVMVLLLEAGVFFQIFLFFAQFIYVQQFFTQLELAELYLLPSAENQNLLQKLRRKLFFSDFITMSDKLIDIKPEEIIYGKDYPSDFIYCVADGLIEITKENETAHYGKGKFFGEISCLTDSLRDETVKALTHVTLIRIRKSDFEQLISKNHEINKKVLALMSDENHHSF